MNNVVPEGWEYNPLSSLADIDKGSLKASTDPNYRFRYVDIASVSTGRIDLPSERISFSESPSRARKKVQSGDVLMSTVRPNLKSFAYFEAKGDDYIASTGFSVIRAVNGNDGRFLFNSILADDITRQIEAKVVGSNYPAINSSDVKNLEVLTPTRPEQKKIAKILTSVDEVIEKTQAQIDKLKGLKTGMMQELLTRGVGVDGKPHTEFKDSSVGRIPKGWDCLSLKSITKRITDGTHQAVKTSKEGHIPFLYVSCIKDGVIDWNKASMLTEEMYEAASKGRKPEVGDILYTAVGSYGNAALVTKNTQFSFQRHIAFIQLDIEKVHPEFISCFLNSLMGKKQADFFAIGNAQLSVTLGDLGKFKVPLPQKNEQVKIALAMKSVEDSLRTTYRKLQSVGNVKKALMQDLLTGKVRVTPDEEDFEC
ncbi:restriction endonuclease subunit S [Photobacterium kagoshimensis]|uniref:restriction endonuclease subunit S n=1 Tax=Photobacterium kagoshimensis TaxID=2910242 RepID=UPI003D12850D